MCVRVCVCFYIYMYAVQGDKEETAVNIAHSCNLILNNTLTLFLTKIQTKEAYNEQLKEMYIKILSSYDEG